MCGCWALTHWLAACEVEEDKYQNTGALAKGLIHVVEVSYYQDPGRYTGRLVGQISRNRVCLKSGGGGQPQPALGNHSAGPLWALVF